MRATPPVLGAPRAILVAWLLSALVDVAFASVRVGLPRGGIGVRLAAHAFDLGQAAAVGLLAAGAAGAWLRFGPRAAAWRYLAIYAAAAAVGVLVLCDDLQGVAGDPRGPKSIAAALVASGCIPAAALVATLLGRGKLRLVLAAGALGAAVVNNALFARNYLGVHLFALGGAATLLAGALAGLELPRALGWLGRTRGAPVLAVQAALCLGAGYAVVVHPSGVVMAELYRIPGAALAPFLSRLGAGAGPGAAVAGAWFHDRTNLPDVPPTGAPLAGPGPVVLLLSIDALRHELVDSGDYADAFPTLHRLAAEGVSFTSARAPSGATVPSLAAMFTGRFYSQLYWTEQTGGGRQKLFPHADDTPRLQSLVARAGGRTAVVMSGTGLADKYGLTNDFQESIGTGIATGRASASLTDDIIKRLATVGDEGLFLYTHYFEPHAPYDRGGTQGTPFERYLREVAIVDRDLARIAAALRERGLFDRAVLIVTGDHGEAFGEPHDFHGTKEHAVTLHDELVHVPLVFWGGALAPRVVPAAVSLADLGPTILDLFGAPTPARFMGQSLVPFLRGESPELERPVVLESGRQQRGMIFRDGLKLLVDGKLGTNELYDLANDPDERANLFDERPDAAERRAELEAYFEAHALRRPGYTMPYRP
ncbi:MAG: sulfatase [Polyangiaceae bacterium]|nr:sulfatase [Polyangiaceae bacterium]